MKKIIILILTFIPFLGIAQDRNVFWAHGFNSSGDFWNAEYARAQRDYKVKSTGFSYNTFNGVPAYSDLLRSGSSAIAGPQTIAIGHSMGGVGIREADRDNTNLYGGMIAFGSPLDGAKAANAAIAGTPVTQFITQSIDNLRRGPIASSSRSKWQVFKSSVTDALTGGGLSVIIRAFASSPILDITNDAVGGFQQAISTNYDPSSQSVADLAEGSSYFNTIKDFTNSKPRIFAYGEEESPVHARMFISSITFDANFTNLLLTAYNTAGLGYKAAADGINTGWTPICWDSCRDRKRREKEAWNVGYDYINRGWEIAWNQLTGARYLESYTSYEDFYECDGGGPGPLLPQAMAVQPICPIEPAMRGISSQPIDECGDCRWVTRPVTRTRWVNGSSDGFIKKSSATAAISKWEGAQARLQGVNHLEMGVHPETNVLLKKAFDGTGGYNSFFRTFKR